MTEMTEVEAKSKEHQEPKNASYSVVSRYKVRYIVHSSPFMEMYTTDKEIDSGET